jgi:EAL domain-containing protein (putative c-di-GMP-specific phosphodiesterase class I)
LISLSCAITDDQTSEDDDSTLVSMMVPAAKGSRNMWSPKDVETDEEVTFFQKHGCDEAQGYFFKKPIAASAWQIA